MALIDEAEGILFGHLSRVMRETMLGFVTLVSPVPKQCLAPGTDLFTD